jgi:hypothetical protein
MADVASSNLRLVAGQLLLKLDASYKRSRLLTRQFGGQRLLLANCLSHLHEELDALGPAEAISAIAPRVAFPENFRPKAEA